MVRRLPVAFNRRINAESFKSNPYILNKISTHPHKSHGYIDRTFNKSFGNGVTSHPSVNLHPVIEFSLVQKKLLDRLNEIQESSYLSIVSGKDVTIHSPNGTGKTIAYLLPIINNVYYIHDVLERLMLKGGKDVEEDEVRIRNLAMGLNQRLGHALLPSRMEDHRQDLEGLEDSGRKFLEAYRGGTTIDKLMEVLYLREPRELRRLNIQSVPMKVWRRRSKDAIYRNIMANPLGSARCVVILVPNKDLVSQVVSYIQRIDILGRLTVQTLTSIPTMPNDQSPTNTVDGDGSALCSGSSKENDVVEVVKDSLDKKTTFYEDQLKMIENVPLKQVQDREVETVALNMGNKISKVMIKSAELSRYSIDGLVPEAVTFKRQPVLTSDTIRWGCVDIVVSTVQSFAYEVVNAARMGIYPVCVVFDEVDMLFENNANRSGIFEIVSKLRPRPRTYNPLVDYERRETRPPPPVQIVNVGSTINFGGIQTCGSMLFERFSTSRLVFSQHNHMISADLHFERAEPAKKLDTLVTLIINNPVKKTLVMCNSLSNCREIYQTLRKHNWPVMAFHSRSALATRLSILKTFQDDEPRIMVATDLVTRGINLAADHIINFDFPTSSSVFFHRIKNSGSKVTSIVTEHSELLRQIRHFASNDKPLSQILSRKRSLGRKFGLLNFQRLQEEKSVATQPKSSSAFRGFFQSKFYIDENVSDDVKYRRVPIKKRLIAALNNYP